MFPNISNTPICLDNFCNLEGVIDVIYNPLRSVLVLQAQKKGIKSQGGLFMLVGQAIAASEYFFDKKIEQEKINLIYNNLINQKRNIVLVGMPGCGKTTIGKRLALELGCQFIDTDDVITEQQQKTPAQIISSVGEDEFRKIESKVCQELATKNGVVIATGGGAVLRQENVVYLKNNGVIFFVDRDIANICPTDDRPLSDSRAKLQSVYDKRYPIYTECADFVIKTDENLEHSISKIKEALNI